MVSEVEFRVRAVGRIRKRVQVGFCVAAAFVAIAILAALAVLQGPLGVGTDMALGIGLGCVFVSLFVGQLLAALVVTPREDTWIDAEIARLRREVAGQGEAALPQLSPKQARFISEYQGEDRMVAERRRALTCAVVRRRVTWPVFACGMVVAVIYFAVLLISDVSVVALGVILLIGLGMVEMVRQAGMRGVRAQIAAEFAGTKSPAS